MSLSREILITLYVIRIRRMLGSDPAIGQCDAAADITPKNNNT